MDKPRLGRGLDALLGGADAPGIPEAATIETGEVAIGQIVQNPYQPRKHFDHDQLAALSASVREHGILQPLVCRNVNGQLQLIAGERRLRAAQEVGLTKVPIRVVDFNDQQTLEAALVENIQRSDLNPIEKALGFKEHLDRFGFSHEQLAKRLGLARSSITNLVNLLELAPEVQDGIRLGQISEAHGKILKGVKDRTKQVGLFKQIVAMGLSVKATDTLLREQSGKSPAIKGASGGGSNGGANGSSNGVDKTAHVRSLEEELRQKLGVPVEIRVQGKDAGQIVLDFAAHDDFERLLEVLRR
jgi:ParB family chromosome partitioning protein